MAAVSFAEFQKLIANQIGVEESRVRPESRLADDLGAESMDVARVVAEIEKKVGRELDEVSMDNVVTVADAYRMLEPQL